jgi:hypothetical protein
MSASKRTAIGVFASFHRRYVLCLWSHRSAECESELTQPKCVERRNPDWLLRDGDGGPLLGAEPKFSDVIGKCSVLVHMTKFGQSNTLLTICGRELRPSDISQNPQVSLLEGPSQTCAVARPMPAQR